MGMRQRSDGWHVLDILRFDRPHREREMRCWLRFAFSTSVARAMVSSYVNCVFMQKKIENYVEDMQ